VPEFIGSLNVALIICSLRGTLEAPFAGTVEVTVGARVIAGGVDIVVKVHTSLPTASGKPVRSVAPVVIVAV
jgi:hypothetical protein